MNFIIVFLLFLLPVLTTASFRIVGGRTIRDMRDAPYIARLYNPEESSTCGGTIIHPQIILTAGHCINPLTARYILVRVGSPTLDRDSTDVYKLRRITVHPHFNLTTLQNDIAILQLRTAVTYSDTVQPATLAKKGEEVEEGTVGVVSGWGALDFGYPGPSDWLKQTELTVLSETTCEDKMKYSKRNQNPEAVFCAAGENYDKSTCRGDSGGPFVVDGTLVGVTSFGYRCGQWHLPVAFTKVAFYRDFIDRESKIV